MKSRRLLITSFIGIACCTVIASLLALSFAYSPLPFEIVAEGEMGSGRGRAPIMLAIRGDDPNRTVPDGLSDMLITYKRRSEGMHGD